MTTRSERKNPSRPNAGHAQKSIMFLLALVGQTTEIHEKKLCTLFCVRFPPSNPEKSFSFLSQPSSSFAFSLCLSPTSTMAKGKLASPIERSENTCWQPFAPSDEPEAPFS
jgi:hypothetical protein